MSNEAMWRLFKALERLDILEAFVREGVSAPQVRAQISRIRDDVQAATMPSESRGGQPRSTAQRTASVRTSRQT
jgi:hypothetical protein